MQDLLRIKTINGFGIIAQREFKSGEKILEFKGELFKEADLPKPYDQVEDHYGQIGPDLYIGPSGGLDDFVNHSCDPNAAMVIAEDDQGYLVAIKNIKPGDEISYDYSLTMFNDSWTLSCSCGSKLCRKIIKEFRYLPKDIKLKYFKLGVVPYYNLNFVYE